MPIPERYLASFQPQGFYHIICKSLPKHKLFLTNENRRYFLSRYAYYLNEFVDTFCYNLLENHCHFLIKVKSLKDVIDYLNMSDKGIMTLAQKEFVKEPSELSLNRVLERQFNSFFVSYTRSINNLYDRKGHLFDTPFRRIQISDEIQLNQVIVYIHANAVKHKIVKDIVEYEWSSYNALLTDKPTALKREELFTFFGGRERFRDIHKSQTDYYYKFED